MTDELSVNKLAWRLTQELVENSALHGVKAERTTRGTMVIDAGIRAQGGFQAGQLITEICMGGLGKVRISSRKYDGSPLESIFVWTDQPAIATLGCQLAGWRLKEGSYSAIGSGPARALALKPTRVYEEIKYKDTSDKAVVVLETEEIPPSKLIDQIAQACKIGTDQLAVILTPTTSIAGTVQVAGRIVESGLFKLWQLGLDPKIVKYAWGCAPIPPVNPEFTEAMGRTNDAILYGGTSCYLVESDDDIRLKELVEKAPSSASKAYGRSFKEIFKEARYDFYKIDRGLFAPAQVVIANMRTGNTFENGEINVQLLKESFDLSDH